MAMIYGFRAAGDWQDKRQANLLDGGAPWYGIYECADGTWITIGPLEPKFWDELLTRLGLDPADMGKRADPESWPAMRAKFADIFKSQPRDHWVALLEGTDACFAPVLSPAEAPEHPHNAARGIFSKTGPAQPMPAPRFAQAETPLPPPAPELGADTQEILAHAGLSPDEIERLFETGAVA
jgi:alpha-methylacyl-CoA racemase